MTPTSAAAQTTAPSHTSSGLGLRERPPFHSDILSSENLQRAPDSLSARKPEGRAKTLSTRGRVKDFLVPSGCSFKEEGFNIELAVAVFDDTLRNGI